MLVSMIRAYREMIELEWGIKIVLSAKIFYIILI